MRRSTLKLCMKQGLQKMRPFMAANEPTFSFLLHSQQRKPSSDMVQKWGKMEAWEMVWRKEREVMHGHLQG